MRSELKKIMHLVDEVGLYLIKKGANDLDIKINHQSSNTKITFLCSSTCIDEDSMETLKERLSVQRQCEVESYYWELIGEVRQDEELFLVGAMVDEVIFSFEEDNLSIVLIRGH